MKIICIGRNYVDHIAELNNERPSEPIVFLKPDTAILPKKTPFTIPEFTNEVHHELEIIVKINKVGKYIDKKFAHKYYDEIGLGIDFTARDIQSTLKEKGLPWEISKAFDGSAIIGDFISKSSLDSLESIKFELTNNQKIVQEGNSNLMIWTIDELISFVSQYFTLKKGDIIFTGTPKGVARVAPNDVLEGFLNDKKLLRLHIR